MRKMVTTLIPQADRTPVCLSGDDLKWTRLSHDDVEPKRGYIELQVQGTQPSRLSRSILSS